MPLPAPLAPLLDPLLGPGRRTAWRRRVARRLLAALLAGLAAAVVVAAVRPAPPEPRVDVVAAARALPAGRVLAADDLTTLHVPASLAPAAGTAATGADGVVGRTLAGPLEPGEPLRGSRLLAPGVLAGLRGDVVALAVPVPSAALAGAVRAGSRVDVVVGARVLAEGARVLAVTVAEPGGGAAVPGGTGEVLLAVGRRDALAVSAATGEPAGTRAPVLLLRADSAP